VLARTEAILTALVFDHSLRIRVKSGVESSSRPDPSLPAASRAAATANPGKILSPTPALQPPTGTTGDANSASASTQRVTELPPPARDAKSPGQTGKGAKSEGSNVTGKINNLLTSDLAQLGQGTQFLRICQMLISFREECKVSRSDRSSNDTSDFCIWNGLPVLYSWMEVCYTFFRSWSAKGSVFRTVLSSVY
jgi:hypothetical protein